MLDLSPLTDMLTSGLMWMLKSFLLYLALPVLGAYVIFGFLLKIRGKALSGIVVLTILVSLVLFVNFGINVEEVMQRP